MVDHRMMPFVIASQRVGAKRRPMTGSAKQSICPRAARWIASSLTLPCANALRLSQAMTACAMALIGRIFVILFAFLAACFVAGMIVVGAVLYPEISDLGGAPIDEGALNVVLGFGFIFLSGFALLPALIVVLITEAFYIRSVLAYALGGALVGA